MARRSKKDKGYKRFVSPSEQKQRGCLYCAWRKKVLRANARGAAAKKSERLLACPFGECPYHELDGIKNYLAEYDRPKEANMPKLFVGGER